MYHLKTLLKSFLFVTVQAHGVVRDSIFHAKNVLLHDKVLTSHIYEAEAGLANAQFSLFHNL